jgi:hypothetical protein
MSLQQRQIECHLKSEKDGRIMNFIRYQQLQPSSHSSRGYDGRERTVAKLRILSSIRHQVSLRAAELSSVTPRISRHYPGSRFVQSTGMIVPDDRCRDTQPFIGRAAGVVSAELFNRIP